MNKKRIFIIALIAVVILAAAEIFSFMSSDRNVPLSETESPSVSNSDSEQVQNIQTDIREENDSLYDKYSGHWVNKENSDLYFDLYTDENNCMRVTYTSFDNNGQIVTCNLIDVSLNLGYDPLLDENKQYLQIFFGDDPSGWINVEPSDDDTILILDNIEYCKE